MPVLASALCPLKKDAASRVSRIVAAGGGGSTGHSLQRGCAILLLLACEASTPEKNWGQEEEVPRMIEGIRKIQPKDISQKENFQGCLEGGSQKLLIVIFGTLGRTWKTRRSIPRPGYSYHTASFLMSSFSCLFINSISSR